MLLFSWLSTHTAPSLRPPSNQDVISELGEPSGVHAAAARPGNVPSGAAPPPPDYFYSYGARGLDVLFCGASHRLTKLVLHANPPGHPDFGVYARCNFRWGRLLAAGRGGRALRLLL